MQSHTNTQIFLSRNGLNVLPTDLDHARLTMSTLPRKGWLPEAQPFPGVGRK